MAHCPFPRSYLNCPSVSFVSSPFGRFWWYSSWFGVDADFRSVGAVKLGELCKLTENRHSPLNVPDGVALQCHPFHVPLDLRS